MEWPPGAWAQELGGRKKPKIKSPFVLGALIHPGLCLNLTDYGVMQELADAHTILVTSLTTAKAPVPESTHQASGVFLRRSLDCAVIKTVHELRNEAELEPYDTVYGVFEEGDELYPGAGFKKRTHVQIAVRSPECIIGYFRVDGVDRGSPEGHDLPSPILRKLDQVLNPLADPLVELHCRGRVFSGNVVEDLFAVGDCKNRPFQSHASAPGPRRGALRVAAARRLAKRLSTSV